MIERFCEALMAQEIECGCQVPGRLFEPRRQTAILWRRNQCRHALARCADRVDPYGARRCIRRADRKRSECDADRLRFRWWSALFELVIECLMGMTQVKRIGNAAQRLGMSEKQVTAWRKRSRDPRDDDLRRTPQS